MPSYASLEVHVKEQIKDKVKADQKQRRKLRELLTKHEINEFERKVKEVRKVRVGVEEVMGTGESTEVQEVSQMIEKPKNKRAAKRTAKARRKETEDALPPMLAPLNFTPDKPKTAKLAVSAKSRARQHSPRQSRLVFNKFGAQHYPALNMQSNVALASSGMFLSGQQPWPAGHDQNPNMWNMIDVTREHNRVLQQNIMLQ